MAEKWMKQRSIQTFIQDTIKWCNQHLTYSANSEYPNYENYEIPQDVAEAIWATIGIAVPKYEDSIRYIQHGETEKASRAGREKGTSQKAQEKQVQRNERIQGRTSTGTDTVRRGREETGKEGNQGNTSTTP